MVKAFNLRKDYSYLADKLSDVLGRVNNMPIKIDFYFDKKELENIEEAALPNDVAEVLMDTQGYNILEDDMSYIRLNISEIKSIEELVVTVLHEFWHLYVDTKNEEWCDEFSQMYTPAITYYLLGNGPNPVDNNILETWKVATSRKFRENPHID